MIKVLRSEDYKKVPWKNGRGFTLEIARASEGAAPLWRLSHATVATASEFSRFPGYQRSLCIVEGAGLRLDTPEGLRELRPGEIYEFSGDVPISASLINGPVTDFNVFVKGDSPAKTTFVSGPAQVSSQTFFVFTLSSDGAVLNGQLLNFKDTLFAQGENLTLERGRVVLVEL